MENSAEPIPAAKGTLRWLGATVSRDRWKAPHQWLVFHRIGSISLVENYSRNLLGDSDANEKQFNRPVLEYSLKL